MPMGVLSATSMIVRRGAGFLYVKPVMDTRLFQEGLLWIRKVIFTPTSMTLLVPTPMTLIMPVHVPSMVTRMMVGFPSIKMYYVHPSVLRITMVGAVHILSM